MVAVGLDAVLRLHISLNGALSACAAWTVNGDE